METKYTLDRDLDALLKLCFKTLNTIENIDKQLNQMSANLQILHKSLSEIFYYYIDSGYNNTTNDFTCD